MIAMWVTMGQVMSFLEGFDYLISFMFHLLQAKKTKSNNMLPVQEWSFSIPSTKKIISIVSIQQAKTNSCLSVISKGKTL